MPKKQNIEKQLKNVNIRLKDYDATMKIDHGRHEPFYRIYQRVINLVTSDQLDLNEQTNILIESMEAWKKRALEAEDKIKDVQKTLF